MKTKLVISKFFLSLLFLFSGLFLIISSAKARPNYFGTWETKYPNSSTKDASCELCHGGNKEILNAYGRDICLLDDDDFESRLLAVEDLDSDGDGTTNYIEIIANAQPGWTEGDNRLYHSGTCVDALVNITVPTSVPEPYDPQFDFFIYVPLIFKIID